jgi:hypothetical protein
MTRFYFFHLFCRKIALFFVFVRPLWREDGSAICSAICQWSESRRTDIHTLLSCLKLIRFLFRRLLRVAGITVEIFLPASTRSWGKYLSSCLLFKTQLKSVGLSVPHRKHITSPLRAQQVNDIYIYRFVTWYINITNTILEIIRHTVFYLKHNVSETGYCLRLQVEHT